MMMRFLVGAFAAVFGATEARWLDRTTVSSGPAPHEIIIAAHVLDDDPEGVVLLVVGGAIDWAARSGQAGRLIEEQLELNAAVEAAAAWVDSASNWGETLFVVTSTHEAGYLTGPGSDPSWYPVVSNGAGTTPAMQFNSVNHTNSLVPLYAKGSAAKPLMKYANEIDPRRGKYVDNAEVGLTLSAAIEPSAK